MTKGANDSFSVADEREKQAYPAIIEEMCRYLKDMGVCCLYDISSDMYMNEQECLPGFSLVDRYDAIWYYDYIYELEF